MEVACGAIALDFWRDGSSMGQPVEEDEIGKMKANVKVRGGDRWIRAHAGRYLYEIEDADGEET